MPVEIEAKMKLDDSEAMIARLKEHGAALIGIYLESNTFYDTDDRQLLAADQGLRLRVSHELSSNKVECYLTHKGPHAYGQLKSREETELSVGSATEAGHLLERLGFMRCLSFQKRRQSWRLDGCRIELDEVPYLGTFIEIEGPTEEPVMRVRESLGLSERPLIKASYVALLTSYLQERGETRASIDFPAPKPQVA